MSPVVPSSLTTAVAYTLLLVWTLPGLVQAFRLLVPMDGSSTQFAGEVTEFGPELAAVTVTVLAQLLLPAFDSVMLLLGSTEQAPPLLGLTRLPVEAPAVTGTVIVIVPPAGIVTAPDAVQERSLVVIVQVVVPAAPPPLTPFGTAP